MIFVINNNEEYEDNRTFFVETDISVELMKKIVGLIDNILICYVDNVKWNITPNKWHYDKIELHNYLYWWSFLEVHNSSTWEVELMNKDILDSLPDDVFKSFIKEIITDKYGEEEFNIRVAKTLEKARNNLGNI